VNINLFTYTPNHEDKTKEGRLKIAIKDELYEHDFKVIKNLIFIRVLSCSLFLEKRHFADETVAIVTELSSHLLCVLCRTRH
jgi:hypothetical protein